MASFDKPKTAQELGLMEGFPPQTDRLVTHENQLLAPYNRWSFQNELALNPTVDVWRGEGPAVPLEVDLMDLSPVTYQNRAGTRFSFDDMVEISHTDGILVLHRGRVIYERYLNGLTPHSLHCWASGSKSVTGTLAATLAHEGLFDPAERVGACLPELQDSGFGDATLRQVLDMTTAVGFAQNDPDPVSESYSYAIAMGWHAAPPGYTGPANAYEFLPTMLKTGQHGERFTYLTPNTDVLAWLLKRRSGRSLAHLLSERLWSRLGAERDAFWIVGPAAVETAGSGLLTTLPDMARFGQMLLQQGRFNGQQIIPSAVVADIEAGADPAAFARGPAAGPTNQGWSYHQNWWITHNPHRAYLALGYGGQMLYIDPAVELVIAKFSSYPTPTPAGNEFYSMFAAFPALARALEDK
jgi:CubicO group peptidase (beta-lactamase class C family)